MQPHLLLKDGRLNLGVTGLFDTETPLLLSKLIDVIKRRSSESPRNATRARRAYKGGRMIHGSSTIDVFDKLEELVNLLPDSLKNTEGTVLSIHMGEVYSAPDILKKKALVYGETTLLLFPEISRWNDGYYLSHYISRAMLNAYVKYEHLIRSGLIIPLPVGHKSEEMSFKEESIAEKMGSE